MIAALDLHKAFDTVNHEIVLILLMPYFIIIQPGCPVTEAIYTGHQFGHPNSNRGKQSL